MWLSAFALVTTIASAASADEFYDRLYNRGLAQFAESNYAGAYSSLKLAAFGLLDDIRRFETAEVHMCVAALRLRHEDDARFAAQRVVAGERISRQYASLPLPDAVRKEFDAAATRLLTAEQLAVLRAAGTATARSPQPQPTQPAPRTIDIKIPPPVIVPAPAPAPTPQPRTQPPAPQPKPAQPPAQPPARATSDVLADADRALNSGDLDAARTLYRSAIEGPQVSHGAALRAAEGLYRARDFAGAIRAFERAGAIGAGEEQYHFYYAVALYENGRYAAAKRELRAALPFIEATPDVARYRDKIEGVPD